MIAGAPVPPTVEPDEGGSRDAADVSGSPHIPAREIVTVRTGFAGCGHVEDIPATSRSVLAAAPADVLRDSPVLCSACGVLRYVNERTVKRGGR